MKLVKGFDQCLYCKKILPEYMIEEYDHIWPEKLCPICGRMIHNKLYKLPADQPFKDIDQQELHLEAVEFIASIRNNCGGHMINPPIDCVRSKRFPDGGLWVDTSICAHVCRKEEDCDRYKKFKLMSTDEIRKELWENGVMNTF